MLAATEGLRGFGEKGSSNPLLDANTVYFRLLLFYDFMRNTRINPNKENGNRWSFPTNETGNE